MSSEKRRNMRTQGKWMPSTKSNQADKTRDLSQNNKSTVNYVDEGEAKYVAQAAISSSAECECKFPFEIIQKEPKIIRNSGFHTLFGGSSGETKILYIREFLDHAKAKSLFDGLHAKIPWESRDIIIKGKPFPMPRKVAWYGPFPYSYSGVILESNTLFPSEVQEIKEKAENALKANNLHVVLNSVLLNLYSDGTNSVAWHSDDELPMGVHPTIVSISLGTTRKFEMRLKDSPDSEKPADYVVHLENGSLLVMCGVMQKDWQHRVPKESASKGPRINLTFRKVHKINKRL